MNLKSRDRILRVLAHKEANRVPVDLGGMLSTGIMGIAYNQLKNYLGIKKGETRIWDLGQQLALVEPEILKYINADVVPLFLNLPKKWKPWKLPDGSPCEVPVDFNPEKLTDGSLILRDKKGHITSKMSPGGYYFDGVYHPLANATSISDLEKYQFYSPIRGIPTTFVINREGKIYKKYIGYRPKGIFEEDIKKLVGR